MPHKTLQISSSRISSPQFDKIKDNSYCWHYCHKSHSLQISEPFISAHLSSLGDQGSQLQQILSIDSKRSYESFIKLLRDGRMASCALNIQNNSNLMNLHFTSLLKSEKDIYGTVFVCEDSITNIEQSSHESAKFSAIGKMAGSIAHEINNPLSIIRMNAEIMMASEAIYKNPERIKEKCDKIIGTIDRLSSIVRALRSISASVKKPNFAWIRFGDLIEDSLELLRLRMGNDPVRIIYDGTAFENTLFYIDHAQITQALINLLNNSCDALKNIDDKWIKVTASMETDFLTIQISDAGKGIPESIAKQMTNELFSTKGANGLGLGLSLVQAYLNSHGGQLGYRLLDGHTCFYIALPLSQVQPKATQDT